MKFVSNPTTEDEKLKKDIELNELFLNKFFSWCVNGCIEYYKNKFNDEILTEFKYS